MTFGSPPRHTAQVPLREQVLQVRNQAMVALHKTHDYYANSVRVWRALQLAVHFDGAAVRWTNRATESVTAEDDLVELAQQYVAVDLPAVTFQQFVLTFENFLIDLARLWLVADPVRLVDRQLTGKDVIAAVDKTALLHVLVEQELRDAFLDRPATWFDYVRTLINITAPAATDRDAFAEIKAARDILAHHNGTATADYVHKTGPLARARAGEPLEIPEPYHRKSWELLSRLTHEIGTQAAAKA